MRAQCASYLEHFQESDRSKFLLDVQRRVDEFRREYTRRFGLTVDPTDLLDRNPKKGCVFYQWIAGENLSVSMCVALWRILSGATILALSYQYIREQESLLEIKLKPLSGESPDVYTSTSRDDFRLLGELRMIAFDGKPHLVGAFRPAQ